jgi:hypothetical protein
MLKSMPVVLLSVKLSVVTDGAELCGESLGQLGKLKNLPRNADRKFCTDPTHHGREIGT